ncbi:gliding motility-associated C-terminal domain-containing protein [Flavisolibacter tropicus]|uniref:Uncharacterized protein n=1 Tax=Flavisolibacter tropicus TaxID=1492898 RepID=A0A172U1F2_9BACT|nr:gliding motility-associated C-terminal domain-containing protein [Flavisolibacter tropicus]ANE53181.1 hypothetical protein SY85_24660 [Flavisolibacter tropicus]
MRKFTVPGLCKCTLLVIATLLLSLTRLQAQMDIAIGTGTAANAAGNSSSGYPCPFQDVQEASRMQFLYKATELQNMGMKAGKIRAIRFTVVNVGFTGVMENVVFKVGTTASTSLTTSSSSWDAFTGTPAATAPQNYQPVNGINTITFPTPFDWDGTSNILIEICNGDPASVSPSVNTASANPAVTWTTGLSFNGSHTFRGNDLNTSTICTTTSATNVGTQTTRPNIIFDWDPAGTCDGSFSAGTVSGAPASAVCNPQTFTLSWMGTLTSGMTLQWQTSADNATWTNIFGANGFNYTATQATTSYYRVLVKCASDPTPKATPGVQVNSVPLVMPLPSGPYKIDNRLTANDIPAGKFMSFNEAYNYLKCGIGGPIVFDVENTGIVYNEQLNMTWIPGTSATNTITFNGNGAIISTKPNSTNRGVIKLNDVDYVTFDNLIIVATSTTTGEYGWGVHLLNNADNNTFKNCTIRTLVPTSFMYYLNTGGGTENYAGIVISSADNSFNNSSFNTLCDNNVFDHNTIEGGSVGITIQGSLTSGIMNNKIINNTIKNFGRAGIIVGGSTNTVIDNNDITRPDVLNNADAFNIPAIQGVLGVTFNANLLITRNSIHNFFAATPDVLNEFQGVGFRLAGGLAGQNNIVANNLIYDINGQGNLFGVYNNGSSNVSFYHNTISLDNPTSYSQKLTCGFYHTSASPEVYFKNNQVSILRGGTGSKYGAYMAETTITGDSLDYNNYYMGSNPTYAIGFYNGTTYNTLATWSAAAKIDVHSLSVNPLYTDAAAGNFKPLSNILNDKGAPVGIANDILLTVRSSSTPDIGAYEYSLAGCLTNFAPGNAFSNVGQTTCPNKSVTLNLKNYDAGSGLTFKWESAPSGSGPWTAISGNLGDPVFTFTMGASTLYYRAAVSCNGGSPRYSDVIQIVSGAAFPAGNYTIDNSQPTDPSGTKNFNSFKEAVDAITCGIAGPVVFNVKPGNTAGLYTEQIRIPAINGTSAVNTVTFKSFDDNVATAELKFSPSGPGSNYVVLLDSARHINFKKLTVTSTNALYGRVIEVAGTVYSDSIVNCLIKAPVPATNDTTTKMAAIYGGTNLQGGSLVFKGNTITNGAKGIYLAGPSAAVFTNNNVIEENTFTGTYHQPIFALNTSNIRINKNVITLNTSFSTTSFNQAIYGIYTNNCDSALQIIGNQVTVSNNAGNLYGIYMTLNEATASNRAKVMNNKIIANSGLTGSSVRQIGMATDNIYNTDIVNNVISVSAAVPGTSNSAYCAAFRSANAFNVNIYNNSLLNTSPATGATNVYNVALEIDMQSGKQASSLYGGIQRIYNNVIANRGGGPAMSHLYTVGFVKSDYNLIYAAGPVLVNTLPTSVPFGKKYTAWAAWRDSSGIEINSIVADPAFISNNDLQPNTADPNSWIMHGRGIQISGNTTDYNGNPRAVNLTDGVPDLGAYEFPAPAVAPPYLTATPATPAPGVTQIFSLATDTVARITWAPGSTVPTNVKLKRYSGVLPAGMAATEKSLYYYVDAEVTGSGTYKYDTKQYFYNSWLNNLPIKSFIKLGKTNAAGTWAANATSTIDSFNNIISDTVQTYIGKFTGMTDGLAPAQPVYVTTADSSNKGTRFWLPYALYADFLNSNAQKLKIYLASDKPAQVTVKVNGTAYSKTYTVAANTTVLTDEIPKTGPNDARITDEGWFKTGVSIESTEPITAYMSLQTNLGYNLGSAMLLPTGAYGTAYQALGYRQHSGYPGPQQGASWVNIVADNDNTVIEITPSNPTRGGRSAGVPFRVTLNRGEVYQLIGAYKRSYTQAEHGGPFNTTSYEGYELSGTTVLAVPNSEGKCLPIGVFSGSSNTTITCDENNHQPGSDKYLFQQNYSDQAWGKYYLTAPLSTINYVNERFYHVYRVMVKDPATVVKRNGVVLTNKINNWYEFSSNVAEYIEADKPVMMAQYNPYNLSCFNDTYAAPRMSESMIYLTPLGHGIKKTTFYRSTVGVTGSVTPYAYLTVIIPDQGLSSLKIDGSATIDSVYAHPNKPGYSVVTKRLANADAISSVESDTTFTATVHAPGQNGFYFYNVGMQIPRIKFEGQAIKNVQNVSTPSNAYTCAKTPFKATVLLPVKAKTLTWKLSEATGVTPSTNVTESNPVPVNKVEINFQEYYVYTLDQSISFANIGNYTIPVSATYAQDANSCDKNVDGKIDITVIDAPTVDYTKTYTGCIDATAGFAGTGSGSNGVALDRWSWSFGDNTTAATQNATKKFNAPGTFNVALQAIATDGCVGNVKKDVVVNALPTVSFVKDSLAICTGTNATLAISNPATNATYSWYDQPTGGTATATGVSYTNSYTAKKYFYVGAVLNGCSSVGRTKAVVAIKPDVTAPTVAVNNVGINTVSFTWEAVANANGYEVSTDGGATWTTPSSGSTGLSHTINGLRSFQTVSLQVRSIGDCNTVKSNVASATTLSDKVYVPNSFTPNADGLNDVLQVYVTGAKEVQLMVFNQWGQKVFESNSVSKGWDGTVNGKKQPSGVYLYTCKVVLANGEVVEKHGSVNLVR